ncbi:MAG: hypothetical protein ACHQ4H_17410 [Ktedonobacterales bacterium]
MFVQVSHSQVGRAIRTHRWTYAVAAPDKHPHEDADAEIYRKIALYDLDSDPYELANLIEQSAHGEIAAACARC